MSKLLQILALGLIVAMLFGMGTAALADEIPVIVLEQPIEQPNKDPKEKKEDQKEEPKLEIVEQAPQVETPVQNDSEPIPAPIADNTQPSQEPTVETEQAPQGPMAENAEPSPEPIVEPEPIQEPVPTGAQDTTNGSEPISDSDATDPNVSTEPVIEGTANETEEIIGVQDEEVLPESDEPLTGKVLITASNNSPEFGEKIKLSSKLIGFADDLILTYQWQINRNDDQGWKNIENANQKSYKFIFTEELANCSWRLIVEIQE